MDVAALIDNVSLLDYVSQYVDMNQDGEEWFGVCPFHKDNDPSFSISPNKNPLVYYCFGCGATGTVLTFIQKYHSVNFKTALRMAADFAGINEEITATNTSNVLKMMRQFAPVNGVKKNLDHLVLASDCMDQYDANAQVLSIWKDEGITAEAMREFNVRYDWKNERIVYPVRMPNGNIISVAGRTIHEDYKERGLRKYTYYQKISQMDTLIGMYENINDIREKCEVVVVEGVKSVLKLWSWGYPAVALSTSHLNEYQTKLLIQIGADIVFALDKGIDVRKDKNASKLRQFCRVYVIEDDDGLLCDKDAPVDRGRDAFEKMYKERRRWR